jgi:hypothetical protein
MLTDPVMIEYGSLTTALELELPTNFTQRRGNECAAYWQQALVSDLALFCRGVTNVIALATQSRDWVAEAATLEPWEQRGRPTTLKIFFYSEPQLAGDLLGVIDVLAGTWSPPSR